MRNTIEFVRLVKPVKLVMAAAIVLMTATPAEAGLVSIGASKDNTIYEGGDLSNGAGEFTFAGQNGLSNRRRGLMAFDIASAVPAGSIIEGVTLTLYADQNNPVGGPRSIELHRLFADWGEGDSDAGSPGGQGAAAAAGDATWLASSFGSTLWATAGGDFDPATSASIIVDAAGFYSWSSASLVSDVQSWLDDPSTAYGWAILGDEDAPGAAKRFRTSDSLDESLRPVLTIDYIAIPAPSAALILAGAMVAGRRRRT